MKERSVNKKKKELGKIQEFGKFRVRNVEYDKVSNNSKISKIMKKNSINNNVNKSNNINDNSKNDNNNYANDKVSMNKSTYSKGSLGSIVSKQKLNSDGGRKLLEDDD